MGGWGRFELVGGGGGYDKEKERENAYTKHLERERKVYREESVERRG